MTREQPTAHRVCQVRTTLTREESEIARAVATHHGLSVASLMRMLLKQEMRRIIAQREGPDEAPQPDPRQADLFTKGQPQ